MWGSFKWSGSAEVYQRICALLLLCTWLTLPVLAEGQTQALLPSFTELITSAEPTATLYKETSLLLHISSTDSISATLYKETSLLLHISSTDSISATAIPSPTSMLVVQTFQSSLQNISIRSEVESYLPSTLLSEASKVVSSKSSYFYSAISSSPISTCADSLDSSLIHITSHVILPTSSAVLETSIMTTVTIVTTKVTLSTSGPITPWKTTPTVPVTTGNGNFSSANDTETREYNGKDSFQFSTPVIVGIAGGSAVFVVILVGLVFCCCKQSRSRSYSSASKTNLSSFWDDNINLSYINGHIELPMDYNDEMVSLDNDSFLNSLDSMSYTNLWASGTAKNSTF